jgi:hypothetical protein
MAIWGLSSRNVAFRTGRISLRKERYIVTLRLVETVCASSSTTAIGEGGGVRDRGASGSGA